MMDYLWQAAAGLGGMLVGGITLVILFAWMRWKRK